MWYLSSHTSTCTASYRVEVSAFQQLETFGPQYIQYQVLTIMIIKSLLLETLSNLLLRSILHACMCVFFLDTASPLQTGPLSLLTSHHLSPGSSTFNDNQSHNRNRKQTSQTHRQRILFHRRTSDCQREPAFGWLRSISLPSLGKKP